MDLDVIFAAIVTTLAALAVIGALAFVLVAEFVAIRAKLAAHREAAARALHASHDGGAPYWHYHGVNGGDAVEAVTVPSRRKWQ